MKKQEYASPIAEIILCDGAVKTLDTVSGDKEGSHVLLSWLVD